MRNAVKLMAGTLAALLGAGGAHAGDLLISGTDQFYEESLFRFEGFYAGGSLGVANFSTSGRAGTAGVIAGTNYALTEAMLAGVEFQADLTWNSGGMGGVDALLLGKLGGYLTDQTLIYGTGGGGIVDGDAAYALGGGVEQALGGAVSVRGELMGTGDFGGGFDSTKGAVGVLWHMN